MNRQEKELVVKKLREDFTQSPASFVVNYRGLSVEQMQDLRGKLREKGGKLQVAKARLLKRAISDIDNLSELQQYFQDQIAIVFAQGEVPSTAKILSDFAKSIEALELIAGIFESSILDKNAIKRIASLPPREVLYAQLCGVLKASIAKLPTVMNMMIVRLLYVLKQVAEKKEQ